MMNEKVGIQMRISTIGYVGKQGVKSIWRNKMFSLASIATMSACIFLFGLFFSILVNFQYIIRSAEEGVAITVFFDEEATDEQSKVIKKKVPAALSLVGLAQKYKSFPKELSGGEQQRVAIARAIVNEPAILLADEPTGNLDPTNSWEIMSLLKEANERGTTVLVVTHNQEIVNEMNERVITMKQGVIVSDERKGGYTDED